MKNRNNITTAISLIDKVQDEASKKYWQKFEENRGTENQIQEIYYPTVISLFTIPKFYYEDIKPSHLFFYSYAIFVISYLITNVSHDLYAYIVTPDTTNLKISNVMEGISDYLNSDEKTQVNALLETYNIDWDIKLNDFKSLLKEISRQSEINQSTALFDKNKKNVEEIVSHYRPDNSSRAVHGYN